jgi:hypothetical protein
MSNDYAPRPEKLWLVGMPPDELEQDAQAWREAAKALGALSEAFKVIGRSDAPFVALLDAKVRCKKHAEHLEAEGAPPKVEYPTVFAEVLAELAGYLGEDLARLAGDLASAVGQPRGEEADREALGTRLESADARPPSATFMDELARPLDLDRGIRRSWRWRRPSRTDRRIVRAGVSFAGSPGPSSCPYSADVGGRRERSHNLLGALEAFGVRVPYLADQFLRGAVALGVGGHLLLRSREVRALQVAHERAHGVVALVPLVHGLSSSCVPASLRHKRFLENDRPLTSPNLLGGSSRDRS